MTLFDKIKNFFSKKEKNIPYPYVKRDVPPSIITLSDLGYDFKYQIDKEFKNKELAEVYYRFITYFVGNLYMKPSHIYLGLEGLELEYKKRDKSIVSIEVYNDGYFADNAVMFVTHSTERYHDPYSWDSEEWQFGIKNLEQTCRDIINLYELK